MAVSCGVGGRSGPVFAARQMLLFRSFRPRALAICVASAALVLNIRRRSTLPDRQVAAKAHNTSAYFTCLDVFRLSAYRYRWEPARADFCTSRTLSPQQVRRCVEAGPGVRPMRVVFMGDSRLRQLFASTLRRLQLPMLNRSVELPLGHDPHYASLNMTKAPDNCFEIFKLSMPFEGEKKPRKLFFCSHRGGTHWLRLDYLWRVYMSRSFRRSVDQMVDACIRHPAACPRLVLLGSGLWYARRFAITETASAADWALRFRRDLAALLPHLRRLAAVTRVVWKLDEPQFKEEAGWGKPGIVMPGLGLTHALVYSMTAGIANVTVWSSMVPESIDFFRSVCWLGRQQPNFNTYPLFAECQDMHHVGATLLDRHVTQLFNFLCRGSDALSPGNCCH
ncbi:uncharacterized protein LOC119099859 isoform X2 [Pollicipes pollicipes]|uniref:uncharacterized protein LOC119099859 isoform X2 n=1 Tax=Pollicipes pollicipes TaxID=41117 RepID=UPI0018855857|nr:uncharacterized protein LOC119099859 isoform X2 [Pollicipes pollicipes]